jgi:hypothetical protein
MAMLIEDRVANAVRHAGDNAPKSSPRSPSVVEMVESCNAFRSEKFSDFFCCCLPMV